MAQGRQRRYSRSPARRTPLVARLALRELNAAVVELRALLDELGEDADLALDDLLPDDDESAGGVTA